jgi:hypothetical protein
MISIVVHTRDTADEGPIARIASAAIRSVPGVEYGRRSISVVRIDSSDAENRELPFLMANKNPIRLL